MVTKRIVPCLDIRDGRVVKGVNFQGLQDVSDPVELAAHYSRSGADELVFYDITASHEGRRLFTDVLARVASQIFIPLTVGGGIRGLDDFERVLSCGADKVSVNSGAIRRPELIREAAKRYGDQCVVLSVDAKRVDGAYHVFLNGGRIDTGMDALDWIERGVDSGAGEVVVNSIDTDGVKKGFDIPMLRDVSRRVRVPIVASGGAGSAEDFVDLFRALPGLSAGLAASIFHFGEVTIPELKRKLAENGACVRL
ncbi:MAG TPA: imidazole glycerol phosphate synthase subunit HisF [Candidatus Intestinimonas stercoravium]|nr:imidazole glycerol phosphate synthase subunit HisF [Candidatus Intestinimonas stercoravium]